MLIALKNLSFYRDMPFEREEAKEKIVSITLLKTM